MYFADEDGMAGNEQNVVYVKDAREGYYLDFQNILGQPSPSVEKAPSTIDLYDYFLHQKIKYDPSQFKAASNGVYQFRTDVELKKEALAKNLTSNGVLPPDHDEILRMIGEKDAGFTDIAIEYFKNAHEKGTPLVGRMYLFLCAVGRREIGKKKYTDSANSLLSMFSGIIRAGYSWNDAYSLAERWAKDFKSYYYGCFEGMAKLLGLGWSKQQYDRFLSVLSSLGIRVFEIAMLFKHSKLDDITGKFTGSPEALLGLLLKNRKNGISFFGRYAISQLVDNLKEPDPSKKKALIIVNKNDHNGSFYSINDEISKMQAQGYDLRIYETDNDKELYNIIISEGAVKPIDLLMVSGHGTRGTLFLGRNHVDASDMGLFSPKKLKMLRDSFSEDARAILDSCSAGKGGEHASNLATFFRMLTGVRYLFAHHLDGNIRDMFFNGGLLTRISWHGWASGKNDDKSGVSEGVVVSRDGTMPQKTVAAAMPAQVVVSGFTIAPVQGLCALWGSGLQIRNER